MTDALIKGFVAARVGEALANYAKADEPLTDPFRLRRVPRRREFGSLVDDRAFWTRLPTSELPRTIGLYCAAVSEWVARVPGLFWQPGSARLRDVHHSNVERRTGRWLTYQPRGKSQLVSGGIGTLKFPPAEDGYRLVTLSLSHNASAGFPTLVSPEVWEHRKLSEGSVVSGSGVCREMPLEWAARFPIVKDISRICLVLDDSEAIRVVEQDAPVEVHPFSVMEYWDGNAELHDFVFATANTSDVNFRRNVSDFFEDYRRDRGREGTYLTTADIPNPLWDATFDDPAEMRLRKAPQLRLIERRVEEAANGQDVVDALIRKLCSLDSPNDLKRLSDKANIPYRRWWTEGSTLADATHRLVDVAIRSKKQLALLHAVHFELE